MAKVGRMVKESSIEEIVTQLSQRPNFFITAVNRFPAPEADILRQKLCASQARLIMIKRRLGQRAIERLNIAGLAGQMEGSVGLVLAGDDLLLTAKHIVEFRKAHENQFSVCGAVIDGQLLDTNYVEQLAQLPPKPVLLAQLIATIESPMMDLVFTVERLLGEVAWVVEQVAAKHPAEPPNAAQGADTQPPGQELQATSADQPAVEETQSPPTQEPSRGADTGETPTTQEEGRS